jgi:hypothetical protein
VGLGKGDLVVRSENPPAEHEWHDDVVVAVDVLLDLGAEALERADPFRVQRGDAVVAAIKSS